MIYLLFYPRLKCGPTSIIFNPALSWFILWVKPPSTCYLAGQIGQQYTSILYVHPDLLLEAEVSDLSTLMCTCLLFCLMFTNLVSFILLNSEGESIVIHFSSWPIFWGSASPRSLFYDEVIACSSLVNHDSQALINSMAGSLTQSKRDRELVHTCYVGVHHCSWHIEYLDEVQTLSAQWRWGTARAVCWKREI